MRKQSVSSNQSLSNYCPPGGGVGACTPYELGCRLPVVYTPIGEGDEPDVFSKPFGAAKAVQVTCGPDLTTKSFDSAFENDVRFKADRQVIGATCFIWDKPSGCAARSKPARGQASCLLRRRGTRKRKRVDGRRPHANSKSWGIRDRCGASVCVARRILTC